MDKTLESFLHPHRKPNVKFHMDGFDGEFEMKSLSSKEGIEVNNFIEEKKIKGANVLIPTIVKALVMPNLFSVELQDALSDKAGHKIISAYDAALIMFNEAELAALAEVYNKHAMVTANFENDIETAKN